MKTTTGILPLSSLETRKLKRTGYIPAFLGGGLLAGLVPIVNMTVRTTMFTTQPGNPFHILMDANWQLMAQLNVLLLVCGACILYHTEYEGNAIQKAETLPVTPFFLFLGKLGILILSCLLPICLEAISLLLCCMHWFPDSPGRGMLLLKGLAFEFALMLPTAAAMLFISSICRNMWICLGTGVILVFMASMLPSGNEIMAFMPFASPYRMLHRLSHTQPLHMLAGCAVEIVLFCLLEAIYQKIRRLL